MTKRFIKTITAMLLAACTLTSCGTMMPTEDTTVSTTIATDSVREDNDSISEPQIYDPAKLPMIYTQEDVCDQPSLGAFKKFSDCATEEFTVPGLNQSMVPQGMDYWAERGWMLISGYCTDETLNGGKGSVLLAVDLQSGKLMGEYYLKNVDGTYYTGHAGGVAVTEKNVYISGNKMLYRIPLTELIDAAQCGDAQFAEEISVPVNGSFCNYSGGILWVGDFQYSTSYLTEEFRHMTNRQGSRYYAWTVGYRVDETTENGIQAASMVKGSYATPDYILSITERIQGMAYLPEVGQIALSQSYGRTNGSTLFFYADPMSETPHDHATLNGGSVPVWFLDNKLETKIMPTIPMSEGIANVGGKLYVLFESGANKYRLGGGKQPTDMVYAVDITKW